MSNGATTDYRRLPLLKIVWGAFALPWQRRRELTRVAFLPLLAVMIGWFALCWYSGRGFDLLIVFCNAIAYSWLAVSIYRLILLGEVHARISVLRDSDLKRWGLCLAVTIGLWLLFYVVDSTLVRIARPLLDRYLPARGDDEVDPILVASGLLAWWPVARFTLMAPAIAVDGPAGPVSAWKMSRGNSLQLILIVCVLPYLLQAVVGRLFGDRLSLFQAASAAVLFSACVVIQVMAVSLAYWQLTAPAPPPTDPPA